MFTIVRNIPKNTQSASDVWKVVSVSPRRYVINVNELFQSPAVRQVTNSVIPCLLDHTRYLSKSQVRLVIAHVARRACDHRDRFPCVGKQFPIARMLYRRNVFDMQEQEVLADLYRHRI